MPKFKFDTLLDVLQTEHGEDLRWVANYDSSSYDYQFHHIRSDLKRELKPHQLDYVIHRSLAVYNKRHAEGVYFHLGDADYLIVHYERGTAYHLFLDERRGLTIMLEPDVSVMVPDVIEEWREHIEGS